MTAGVAHFEDSHLSRSVPVQPTRVGTRPGTSRTRPAAPGSTPVGHGLCRPPTAFTLCNDRSLESRYDSYLTMASSYRLCNQAEHFMKFVFADKAVTLTIRLGLLGKKNCVSSSGHKILQHTIITIRTSTISVNCYLPNRYSI